MTRAGPWKKLTDREWQVIDGIRRDLKYESIATELGISHETVRNHVKNIALKFDNPAAMPPRVLIRYWAMHAVWANGRAEIDRVA